MSVNGRTAKKNNAGKYCSPRAAQEDGLVAQTDQHQ